MDTLKYRNIVEKACHFRLCKLWAQCHHKKWTKIIDERANSFPLHCVLLGCFASFLSRSYNDHSYTTNATTRQDMASRNSSGVVTELLSSIRLLTWDLTCAAFLSQAPFPPLGRWTLPACLTWESLRHCLFSWTKSH